MILQKYDSYKDSGVEWLGEIPKSWEVKRGKDLFKLSNIPAKKGHDLQLLSVYSSIGVRPRKDMEQRGNKAFNIDEYWIVKKNDIIINKLLAWMGGIGLSKYEGVTSPAYDILRKKIPLKERFYELFFRLKKTQIEFKRHSRGILEIRLRLYNDRFGQISFPYPSENEQNFIIKNLDKSVFIVNKKIKLLQEKITSYEDLKKSIINETICRGLNKNVDLKDSEIEWIGNIPKHWRLIRGKDTFYEIGKSKISASEGEDQGKYKFFTSSVNQSKWLNTFTETDEEIIFSTGGIAGVHYCDKNFSYSTDCYAIKNKGTHLKYYFYYFKAILYEIDTIAFQGAGLRHLQKDFIKAGNMPNPPKEEQIQIANYLDEKTTKIDNIISKIKDQINTLKEFRKTLINDVVTGKVRVEE